MKTQKFNLVDVTLNSHITPLSASEVANVKGGTDGYGGTLQGLCRFLQKLVHGN